MGKYTITQEALDDLRQIYVYGKNHFGIEHADEYIELMFEQFEIIADRPFTYAVVQGIKEDFRRCVYRSDSIIFELHSDHIEIITIIGQQDLNKKLTIET